MTALGAFCLSSLSPACTSARPLKVAICPWIGYEAIYLARDFKWLPVSVQLYETKSLSESAAALRDGSVDAACLTLDEILQARAAGVPLTVVLVFDVSAGADAVVARPDIRTATDLAGQRIGVEHNALGFLMLDKLLETAGLTASALTVIDCPPDRQLEAWQAGEVDAVISYEPTVTLLQRQGASLLFDSRQVPDTIFDILAVRNDRAGGLRDALKALVAGHFRGLAHMQTNRQDAIYRIAARESISPDEVVKALAGVMLPSLSANREYLVSREGRLLPPARNLSSLMVKSGLLKQEDALDSFMASTWLPRNEAR